MATPSDRFKALQDRLGYCFKRSELLELSLTHPSYIVKRGDRAALSNQRLEFLGDAALSFIMAQKLYTLFPDQREGALAKALSVLGDGRMLTALALEIELDKSLFLSEAERQAGGARKASILEDAFEALIGALYLDSDWDTTRRVVLAIYGNFKKRLNQFVNYNPKGSLQEKIQSIWGNDAITYQVERMESPDHRQLFKAEVIINGSKHGEGIGYSKKQAEATAAQDALAHWAIFKSEKNEAVP